MQFKKIVSIIALTVATLGGNALFVETADAVPRGCINTVLPQADTASYKIADGRLHVMVRAYDYDNLGRKGLLLYQDGVYVGENTTGVFDGDLPMGHAWDFYYLDVDRCGRPLRWWFGKRFTNY